MKRNLAIVLIIVAFFAGSITTGGVVNASFDQCNTSPPNGKSNGQPFLEIWDAICDLQDQINAIDGSQVYETSETVLVEAGTQGGVEFEISCMEGDWMNVSDKAENHDVKAVSNPAVPINSLRYDLVKEPFSQITGATGLVEIGAIQLFDVEVTLTILCFSPASLDNPPPLIPPIVSDVIIPPGSSVPGCEENNECYSPFEAGVVVGSSLTWTNIDSAAHTVTSGSANEGPSGVFDSGFLSSATMFSHKFDSVGEFPYFCQIHPWMEGVVVVVEDEYDDQSILKVSIFPNSLKPV